MAKTWGASDAWERTDKNPGGGVAHAPRERFATVKIEIAAGAAAGVDRRPVPH